MNIFTKLENDINKLNGNSDKKKIKRLFKKNIKKINKNTSAFPLDAMNKKYDHILIEKNKLIKWRINEFKNIKDITKKPYTIILPPPNVTGKLHIGHAWNGSIQDTIIRYKKSQGFDTLFIPSMDHAGIATQAKVENELAKDGIYKSEIGNKEFIKRIWSWKKEYASSIRMQWEKLGLLFNFENEVFTLDKSISKAVNSAFIKMYNDNLIYKGTKAINWDCKLKTSLSNIEVTKIKTKSKCIILNIW